MPLSSFRHTPHRQGMLPPLMVYTIVEPVESSRRSAGVKPQASRFPGSLSFHRGKRTLHFNPAGSR